VGAFVFFNRIVGKLSVFEVFLGAALLWCGALYIVNVLADIEHMCCVTRMQCVHLLLYRPTDVGAVVCLTLLLPNLNVNILFVSAALLWCGTLYIVNVLAVIEQGCCVLRIKYVYLVLSRPSDVGAFVFI
jgi:hypothetical protein